MKKFIFILLFNIICIGSNIGQRIAFYDAIYLNSIAKNNSDKFKLSAETRPLFEYYFNMIGASDKELSDTIQKNPFLSNYFQGAGAQSILAGTSLPGLASSIGGLDVTNIADGLAKFLVKRTKEELNVAFFSKFKEILNDPKYRDLKTLFPNTWELLDAIGDEIYDYNRYLQNLREEFQTDINILDENLPGIISNHQDFFNENFEYAVSLNSACYITKALKNNIHPGDILDQYPLKFLKKKDQNEYFNKDWSGAIQTLQLFSESLRNSSSADENYWVSYNQVKELVNNKNAFQIYMGLIYQVAKNKRYNSISYENNSFIDLLDSIAPPNFDANYTSYYNFIVNLAIKLDALNEMKKEFSKIPKDSVAFENYAKYFKTSVGLIEYCTEITELYDFKDLINTELKAELKDYFKVINATTDLAIAINRRNYSAAINRTVSIYNIVRTKVLENKLALKIKNENENDFNKKNKRALKKYIKSHNKLVSNNTVTIDTLKTLIDNKFPKVDKDSKAQIESKLDIESLEDTINDSKVILSSLARYGTFMASVATAKTSDEISNAIEAAALPSGSSRIKRETPFNVSLNAYTGLFMGHELIVGVCDKKMINSFGLTAPVGVAVSTGARKFLGMPSKKESGHWSYSAFVSIIDIGVVAAFRFQNDSVAQVPTIQLKDIFSPGLFFSVGIPKCPLSVNMGAQVGPNLRAVNVYDESTDEYVNKYQNNVYWRFSASIVVDIPIFNFYTKSK